MKLARLPDRTPIKITITVKPDLNRLLQRYTEFYRQSYGEEESVAELIPFMLQAFLEADRGFTKALRALENESGRSERDSHVIAASESKSSS